MCISELFHISILFKTPNGRTFITVINLKSYLFFLNISLPLTPPRFNKMSQISPNARKEVNNALTSSGSAAVGQMVDTANSSIEKRRRNKEEKEKRDAAARAAKLKADAAVSPKPLFPKASKKLKSPSLPGADVYQLIEERRLRLDSCLSLHLLPSFPSAITVVTIWVFSFAGWGIQIHW